MEEEEEELTPESEEEEEVVARTDLQDILSRIDTATDEQVQQWIASRQQWADEVEFQKAQDPSRTDRDILRELLERELQVSESGEPGLPFVAPEPTSVWQQSTFWQDFWNTLDTTLVPYDVRRPSPYLVSAVQDDTWVRAAAGPCSDAGTLERLWNEMVGGELFSFGEPEGQPLSAYLVLEATHHRTMSLNRSCYIILFRQMVRKQDTEAALVTLQSLLENYVEQVQKVWQWIYDTGASTLVDDSNISPFLLQTTSSLREELATNLPAENIDDLLLRRIAFTNAFLRLVNFDIDETWAGAKSLARIIDVHLKRETEIPLGKTKKGARRVTTEQRRREAAKRLAKSRRRRPCPPGCVPAEGLEEEEQEEEEEETPPSEGEPPGSTPEQQSEEEGQEAVEEEQAEPSPRARQPPATRRGQGGTTAKTTIDKKSWGYRKYQIESYALRALAYANVRVRDQLLLLQDLQFLADLRDAGSSSAPGFLNLQGHRLFLAKKRQDAAGFLFYVNRFRGLMQKGEEPLFFHNLIPSPFSQSTYEVDATSVDLANMFMWPDRFANTLNPLTFCMTERMGDNRYEIKVKSQIVSDLHDPWYWYHYRRNVFRSRMGGSAVLMSKLAIYVSRSQGGQVAVVWEPTPDEEQDIDELPLFNGSSRVAVDPSVMDSESVQLMLEWRTPDPHGIYLTQYMNRLARRQGPNSYTNPDTLGPHVMGEHVFMPDLFTWRNVPDIVHTQTIEVEGERAFRKEVRATSSEFTLYMETLQPFSCTSRDTTYGSYISYKIDIHPGVQEPTEEGTYPISAGHVYYMHITPTAERLQERQVWFKELLKTKSKSKKKKDTAQQQQQQQELTDFKAWLPRTIQIDVVCDNSLSYDWRTFPEWMILMFKLLIGLAYWARRDSLYEQFMIIVPLDRLKRLGNVPENLLVYMLRRYLNFGLVLDQTLQGRSLYTGRSGQPYHHDYWVQNYAKIYTHPQGELLELHDPTEPFLIRPIPTVEEAWKMWQFYTQYILMAAVTRDKDDSTPGAEQEDDEDEQSQRTGYPPLIENLTAFLRADEDLKSSRLREIGVASTKWLKTTETSEGNTKYTPDKYVAFLRDEAKATFNPLTQDTDPVDWATAFPRAPG